MSKEEKEYQDFLAKQKQERQEELEALNKIDQEKVKVVNDSLRDKGVSTEQNFQAKGKKEAGVSAGYVATEKETGNTFILKQFYKNANDMWGLSEDAMIKAYSDRNDGVRELLGAAMYQFLLYDRAPKEQLVKADNPKLLYVRSKFFENVVPFSQFSGAKQTYFRDSPKLKTVEGLEKVLAACQILGELDYHGQNIMVQTQKDENGQERHVLTKIDHGRSLASFHKDFSTMISKTAKDFKSFGYSGAIESGNLSFDIDKYSAALKQMTSQFSEDQINAIVDQKIAELKWVGFDPKGFDVISTFGSLEQAKGVTVNTFEDMAKQYKDLLKQNLNNMKQISEQVEIVAKFTGVSEQFKKGGWLNEIAASGCKDPIEFAVKNRVKIEGQDAASWAVQNNKLINGQDPVAWSMQNKRFIEGQHPIAWAVHNGKMINNQDPIAWAKEKDYKIKGQDLEIWKAEAEQAEAKFVDKVLSPLVENFLKDHLLEGKELTKKEVEKFYGTLLKKMHKNGFINDKKMEALSGGKEVKAAVDELLKLESGKISLPLGDRINYSIGKFCNDIGYTTIGNHFTNKISPENLSKINSSISASKLVAIESINLKGLVGKHRAESIETKFTDMVKNRERTGQTRPQK